jgi:flagellar protein FlbD
VIRLTRLSGYELYLNADLICSVEAHPDTVVTLVDGKHYVVTEPTADVVQAITRYRASVLALADSLAGPPEEPDAEATDGPGRSAAAGTGQLYVLRGDKD